METICIKCEGKGKISKTEWVNDDDSYETEFICDKCEGQGLIKTKTEEHEQDLIDLQEYEENNQG